MLFEVQQKSKLFVIVDATDVANAVTLLTIEDALFGFVFLRFQIKMLQ